MNTPRNRCANNAPRFRRDPKTMSDGSEQARDDAEIAAVDFQCAVPVTGAEDDDERAEQPRRRRDRPTPSGPVSRRSYRRVTNAFVVLLGLFMMGGIYSLLASASSAQQTARQPDVARGRQLFEISCITCHGANLQGVNSRGPSLIGTGGAATYFQMTTGRMPAAQQGPDQARKPTTFTADEINDIVAFVQSVAGGPEKPTGDLRNDAAISEGGELFRLNCASCHNFAGKGAPLSAGKIAPGLNDATDLVLYTAMLTGPENMPVFSNNQLTPDQKKAIISYIQSLKSMKDPGGLGLDRIGPVSEGLVIWVVGVGLLMGVILWIGARS
jgi:quinol---cytochrome-c reductase cytochrome c subunit